MAYNTKTPHPGCPLHKPMPFLVLRRIRRADEGCSNLLCSLGNPRKYALLLLPKFSRTFGQKVRPPHDAPKYFIIFLYFHWYRL
jgi:hypothetical protein